MHEKYYSGALYNDIALLILEEPFDHANNIDIICLPKQGDIILDQECLASGWGKDTFGKFIPIIKILYFFMLHCVLLVSTIVKKLIL